MCVVRHLTELRWSALKAENGVQVYFLVNVGARIHVPVSYITGRPRLSLPVCNNVYMTFELSTKMQGESLGARLYYRHKQ